MRRDQWDGGPMRWGIIGMGGAWELIGGPMRWGTNENRVERVRLGD